MAAAGPSAPSAIATTMAPTSFVLLMLLSAGHRRLPPSISVSGQPECQILTAVHTTADGDHDVLFAVLPICHGRAALRRRHEHGSNFLRARLVVGAQHRTARMV